MSFIKNIEKANNETLTQNGDLAYKSTFNKNLDLFGLMGALNIGKGFWNNDANKQKLLNLFYKAYDEDKVLALKNLIYLRDVTDGLGKREAFRTIFFDLAKKESDAFICVAKHLHEFGRYDDLVLSVTHAKHNKKSLDYLTKIILFTLIQDLKNCEQGKPVSLLAKWMPSENKQYKKEAKLLTEILFFGNKKEYRIVLSTLRKYIGIIEHNLVEKDYTFDYSKLPVRALRKYTEAFKRNDFGRYQIFKQSLQENLSTISKKADKLYPHEIIQTKDEELRNTLWESLPKDILNGNVIVVRDGSYSMLGLPLDVATALSIYSSERLTGEFKNKFITFSNKPQLVTIPSLLKTVTEKYEFCMEYNDVANTDLDKTFELIYEANLKASPQDRLDKIIIISDMQFDQATVLDWREPYKEDKMVSTFDKWKKKFIESGMVMPKTIFWNVAATNVAFPTTSIDNLYLVSGFSQNIFKAIVQNESVDGVQFMLAVLSKYDKYFQENDLVD